MSGLWCYIQRAGAGAAITGLTLVDRRQARQWSPGSTSADPQLQRQAIEAAARWLAEQLAAAGKKKSLTLCLDLDGSRCGWLSAPSPDHEVVLAAARGASVSAGDESAAGPGLGAIWSTEHGDPSTDLAVQELSGDHPGNGTASGAKHRLAVLAMPDACVRVLIDELDRLGIEVAGVVSLWHALAAAWDPSNAEALAGGSLKRAAARADVGISEPVTAVVALDPIGRLCWAWSRAGALVAAGAQRLRVLEVARADGSTPAAGTAVSTPASAPVGTRFRSSSTTLEVSASDTGRVVAEWLAWSAQLGVAPARVVCIGPADVVATGLSTGTGLGALGLSLAAGWTGAHAAAVEDDEVITTTLMRLASVDEADSDGALPRVALVDLSTRPGRLSRAMHGWLAAAGLAAAAAIGMVAWRVDASAKELAEAASKEKGERTEIAKQVVEWFPKIAADADPARTLVIGLADLRKNREEPTPERPIAEALGRIVVASANIPDLKLKKVSITSITGIKADYVVTDAAPGVPLIERLKANPQISDTVGVRWSGTATSQLVVIPGSTDQRRLYKLTGFWQDLKPAKAGEPAATAAPAAEPNADEKPAPPKPQAPVDAAPSPTPAPATEAPKTAPRGPETKQPNSDPSAGKAKPKPAPSGSAPAPGGAPAAKPITPKPGPASPGPSTPEKPSEGR